MSYKIVTRPEGDYWIGEIWLDQSLVDSTDFAHLEEKNARNEARNILKAIKKETDGS